MSDSVRITLRISSNAANKLNILVDEGEFKNLSEVVRTSIENFISEKFAPKNVEKISVDLPKASVETLQQLVNDGDAVSMDDAIRNAVREYVNNRIKLLASEKIREKISDIELE